MASRATGPLHPTRRSALIGGAALAAFQPGAWAQAAPTKLRFARSSAGHVILPVTLRGEPAHALLDNGADLSVLDGDFARQHELASGQTFRLNGETLQRSVSIDYVLGPMKGRLAPLIIDLGTMPGADVRPDMVLGCDVLSALVMTLDFDFGEISLAPVNQKFAPSPGAIPQTLIGQGAWKRLLAIDVEGRSLRALVDLGSDAALMLRAGDLTASWEAEGRKASTMLAAYAKGGAMELAESRVTRARSLKLGGWIFSNLPATIYDAEHPAFGAFEAVIGIGVLSRFLLSLDLAGRHLWLRPNAQFDRPFRVSTVGAGVTPDGEALQVDHVAPGSPAEAAGFRVGERIVAIDGKPPRIEQITGAAAGTKLRFSLADGKVRTVTAAPYF